jgi:hypothetical protein
MEKLTLHKITEAIRKATPKEIKEYQKALSEKMPQPAAPTFTKAKNIS